MTISEKSKLPSPKTKRLLLKKPSEKISRERELWLPKKLATKRIPAMPRTPSKRLKIRLPRRLRRRSSQRRNDLPYLIL